MPQAVLGGPSWQRHRAPSNRQGKLRRPRARAAFIALIVVSAAAIGGCDRVDIPPSATGVIPTPTSSGPPANQPSGPLQSQPEGSASIPTIDACALLTPADLATIVGGPDPVAQPLPGGGWVAGQCAWNSPSSSFVISVGTAASIQAFGDPAAPDATARLAAFKQRLETLGSARDIDGIGDGAVLGTTGMAFYKGDDVYGDPPAESYQQAVDRDCKGRGERDLVDPPAPTLVLPLHRANLFSTAYAREACTRSFVARIRRGCGSSGHDGPPMESKAVTHLDAVSSAGAVARLRCCNGVGSGCAGEGTLHRVPTPIP